MERQLNSEDWKFCAIVDLGIEAIDNEQEIHFNEHFIRLFKPSDKIVKGYFIAEVYTYKSKYTDHETAYHSSLDILNKVLARISIATFRSCKIHAPVGVTQFKVENKQSFKMLLTANYIVQPQLKNFNSQNNPTLFTSIDHQELNESISEIGLAINSTSIYLKFSHYYNCIERIAHFKTTENIKQQCKKCGEINEISVKATGNKMREFFIKYGYESKEFNKCRAIRAKLAHGSSERTRDLNNEVFEYLPKIQKVALQILEENTSIKVLNGEIIPESNNQFIEIIGKKRWNRNFLSNAAYDVISHSVKFNVLLNLVGENEEKEGFITEHIPITFTPKSAHIFPYAWPY